MLVTHFLSCYYAHAYIKAFRLMTAARLESLDPIESSDESPHFIDADRN